MARSRDYVKERLRGEYLARQRGFGSRAEQRRYHRRPSTLDELVDLPERAREIRSDSLSVTDLAQAERISVELAAARLGVPMSAVRWWAIERLGPTRQGRISVTRRDALRARPVAFGDTQRTEFVAVRGWKRKEVDRIFAIQWQAAHGLATDEDLDWPRAQDWPPFGRGYAGAVVRDRASRRAGSRARVRGVGRMNRPCEFCGGPADQLHHATGRDHEGRYLDSMLVLPSDHDCHVFVHDDWRHEEIDELKQPRSIIEYMAVRLRRLAMNLGRIDQHLGGGTFWGLLADAAASWADELDDHVRLLDSYYPGWRGNGGFMR